MLPNWMAYGSKLRPCPISYTYVLSSSTNAIASVIDRAPTHPVLRYVLDGTIGHEEQSKSSGHSEIAASRYSSGRQFRDHRVRRSRTAGRRDTGAQYLSLGGTGHARLGE